DDEEGAARLIGLDDRLLRAERDLVGVLGDLLQVATRKALEERHLPEQVRPAPTERAVRSRTSGGWRRRGPAGRHRSRDGARERLEDVLVHPALRPVPNPQPTPRDRAAARCWSRAGTPCSVRSGGGMIRYPQRKPLSFPELERQLKAYES